MGVMDLPLAGDPCLDRPAVCDPGSGDPQQAAGLYLSDLVDKCHGWYCAFDTSVTFDAQGCAIKLTAPGTAESIECLKTILEAERWLCAPGEMVITGLICQ
jgi:hypothetical protein